MKCGVAVWNWFKDEGSLTDFVGEVVAEGFEAISVQPRQILGLEAGELAALHALLDAHGMPVTVHAAAGAFPEETLVGLLERLGPRLHAVTFDGIMAWAPTGRRWDAARMVQTLLMVERVGAETGVRYGIEDFPIDAEALAEFGVDLQPVAGNARWGMLVDLGHLNLRRHDSPYFGDRSIAENLERLPLPVHELHIHDNPGDRDLHLPLGSGTLDYGEAARALRARGFDGIATIEVCPGLHGRQPREVWGARADSLNRWRDAWAS